jgi:hypothetical protein
VTGDHRGADGDDVTTALAFAAGAGLEAAVRGGGHSLAAMVRDRLGVGGA